MVTDQRHIAFRRRRDPPQRRRVCTFLDDKMFSRPEKFLRVRHFFPRRRGRCWDGLFRSSHDDVLPCRRVNANGDQAPFAPIPTP